MPVTDAQLTAVSGNNWSYLANRWPMSWLNSTNAFPLPMRASVKKWSNFRACVKLRTASRSWPNLQMRYQPH